MTWAKGLTLLGLLVDAIGAYWLLRGAIISDKEALDVASPRFAHQTDAENMKLPGVLALIRQRKLAKIGALLLGVGFILQGLGAWLQ